MHLDETKLKALVSGPNKSWLTRNIAQQKKYGNTESISADVLKDETGISITFTFGESWGTFMKEQYGPDKGKWLRRYGNLRKEEQITKLVNEIAFNLDL